MVNYTIVEDSDPNVVHARIESRSEDSLEEGMLKYFTDYNPLGYGTFLESRSVDEGLYTAIMARYSTCE